MESNGFIQPNHITTAKYKLTALEMNILYLVISHLQNRMNKEFESEYKEQQITLQLKDVDKNNNYSRVLKAIKSLRCKSIEIEYNIPNSGKVMDRSTNILSGHDHVRYSKYITVDVPKKVSKFLCYIGGGYTSLQLTIALGLSSIYSKRIYELCCRWSDNQTFSNTISFFKEYLNIDDKYKKFSHFKTKVLDISERELKEKADLYFTYTVQKEGRKYHKITLRIHTNLEVNNRFMGMKHQDYTEVYIFLNRYFPNHKDNRAQVYTDRLVESNKILILRDRIRRFEKNSEYEQKTKSDIKNLLLHVILPELGVTKKPKKTKNHLPIKRRQ